MFEAEATKAILAQFAKTDGNSGISDEEETVYRRIAQQLLFGKKPFFEPQIQGADTQEKEDVRESLKASSPFKVTVDVAAMPHLTGMYLLRHARKKLYFKVERAEGFCFCGTLDFKLTTTLPCLSFDFHAKQWILGIGYNPKKNPPMDALFSTSDDLLEGRTVSMQARRGEGTCAVAVPVRWVLNPKKDVRPLLKVEKIKLLELSLRHQVREFELQENQQNLKALVNEVVAMSTLSECLPGAAFHFVQETSGQMMSLLRTVIAREFHAWEESTVKSLSLQEFAVRKDGGVDDEAATTRLFADLAEVIQQNLTCAERCTDLLAAVELGSRELSEKMNPIQEDVRALMKRVQDGWMNRVASLSIPDDLEKCMTWKSLAWKSRLLDMWDQILKNKWSLGDTGAKCTKEAAAAAQEAYDKKTEQEQVRRRKELQLEQRRWEEMVRWTAEMKSGVQRSGEALRSLLTEHLKWLESFGKSPAPNVREWLPVYTHLDSYDPVLDLDLGEFSFDAVSGNMLEGAEKDVEGLSMRLLTAISAWSDESGSCNAESLKGDLARFVEWSSGFDCIPAKECSRRAICGKIPEFMKLKTLVSAKQTLLTERLCEALSVGSRNVMQCFKGEHKERFMENVQNLLEVMFCIRHAWLPEDRFQCGESDEQIAVSSLRSCVEKAVDTLASVVVEFAKLLRKARAAWSEVSEAKTAEAAISGTLVQDLQKVKAWSSLPDMLEEQRHRCLGLRVDDSLKYDVRKFLNQVECDLLRNCEDLPKVLETKLDSILSCNVGERGVGEAGKELRRCWHWLDLADVLLFVSNELTRTIKEVEEECAHQMFPLLDKHKNKNSAFDGVFRLVGLHSIFADACPRWTKLRESLTELLRKAEEHLDAELARVSLEYVPPMGALSAMLEEFDLNDATFESTMFDGLKKVVDGHRDHVSSVVEALFAKADQILQMSASLAWREEMEAVIAEIQVCIPLEKVTGSRISHRVHQIDQILHARLNAGLVELQQHLDINTEEAWKQIVKVVEDSKHGTQFQYLSRHLAEEVSHVQRDVAAFKNDGTKALNACSVLFRMSDIFQDLQLPLIREASVHEQKMLKAMFSRDKTVDATVMASTRVGIFASQCKNFEADYSSCSLLDLEVQWFKLESWKTAIERFMDET